MKLLNLILVNIKRQLKNPAILLMLILFPLGMLLFLNDSDNEKIDKIGIINNENSIQSEKLINNLKERYEIRELTEKINDNLELIENNELTGIYVIPNDFENKLNKGEIPNIEVYKKEDSLGTLMSDSIIESFIKDSLKEKSSNGINDNYIKTKIEKKEINDKQNEGFNVIMICYFMFMGGSIISEEIINLKNQNVLKRMITTSNTDKEILGGLFISSFLIQGILSSLVYLIVVKLLKIENSNIPLGILTIFLSSIVSTSIIIAVTRWIRNITLASLTMVIFSLIMFCLGTFNSNIDILKNPPAIFKVGIVSPFYWMLKIIETENLIIPVIILILMSLVFFTLGSFKLRDFVKE